MSPYFFSRIALIPIVFVSLLGATQPWIANVQSLTIEEKKLLQTMLHLAMQRCQATVHAQSALYALVQATHEESKSLIETRLNPASSMSFAEKNSQQTAMDWHQQKNNYLALNSTYHTHVEYIESVYPRVYAAFESVRQEARAQVLKANALHAHALKDLALSLGIEAQKSVTSIKLLQGLWRTKSWTDYVMQWLASWLVPSFVQCNEQVIAINNHAWSLVEGQLYYGNEWWRIIEEARLAVYRSYYYALTKDLEA